MSIPEKIQQFHKRIRDEEPDLSPLDYPFDSATYTITHESSFMEKADAGPQEGLAIDQRQILEWLATVGIRVERVEVLDFTITVYLDPASLD